MSGTRIAMVEVESCDDCSNLTEKGVRDALRAIEAACPCDQKEWSPEMCGDCTLCRDHDASWEYLQEHCVELANGWLEWKANLGAREMQT